MTTHGDLLVEHRKNMNIISAAMSLHLLCLVFVWVPLMDDEMSSGYAGAVACAVGYLVFIVVSVFAIVLTLFMKNETAATFGWLAACVTWLGLLGSLSDPLLKIAFSVLPVALTLLSLRMLWLIYQLGANPPPQPPVHYPVTPPPGDGL